MLIELLHLDLHVNSYGNDEDANVYPANLVTLFATETLGSLNTMVNAGMLVPYQMLIYKEKI